MKKNQQTRSRKRCRRLVQLQRDRTLWAQHVRRNLRRLAPEDRAILPRMAKQGLRRRNRAMMALGME